MVRERFRVIKGGRDSPQVEKSAAQGWSEQVRQFYKIRAVAIRRQGGLNIGPRASFAVAVAAAATFAVHTAVMFADGYMGKGSIVPDLVSQRFSVWLALVSGFMLASGILSYSFSKLPKTHSQMMDSLLSAYDPVSKDAYRRLQAGTIAEGELRWEYVERWLEEEGEAIANRSRPAENPNKFTRKKV